MEPLADITAQDPAALFMYSDRIVWWSRGFVGAETTRPTVALLIGGERPIEVDTAAGAVRARALLVGPNVARRLRAERAGFYSLSLDPAHPACRWLRDAVLAGREWLDLSDAVDARAIAWAGPEAMSDCAACHRASERLLAQFFPQIAQAPQIDARVRRVAAWLREQVPARADMRALGAVCALSPGRLTHLFTEELGVSIRTYLVWVKMCKAVELLGLNQSVADVAAAMGFSDSAHLCRVLRTYYAAAPSFIANRALVRVTACAT